MDPSLPLYNLGNMQGRVVESMDTSRFSTMLLVAGVMEIMAGDRAGWLYILGASGFVVFVLGKRYLEGKGEPPNPELLKEKVAGPLNREWSIYLLATLGVGLVWLALDGAVPWWTMVPLLWVWGNTHGSFLFAVGLTNDIDRIRGEGFGIR
mgnify:CR=1 FL=1